MADKIYVGKKAASFSTSPRFPAYDMVLINIDDDQYVSAPYVTVNKETWISAGLGNGTHTFIYDGGWKRNGSAVSLATYGLTTHYSSVTSVKSGDTITVEQVTSNDETTVTASMTRSGRCLEQDNPYGTIQMAENLLAAVYGLSYQPYQAGSALLDPAAELGDAITAYGIYGGLYAQDLTFSRLMASDIGAAGEEEIDNEYQYKTADQRKYSRKLSEMRSELTIQASQIAAKVSKTGGDQSFSWVLESDHFSVLSGSTEMLHIDRNGSTFGGTIYADSIKKRSGGDWITGSQIKTQTITGGGSGNIAGTTIAGSNIIGGEISAAKLTSGVNGDIDKGVNAYNRLAYGFDTISTNNLYVSNEQGLHVDMTAAYWCYNNGMYYLGHY